jgi:hypothetical protein
MGTRGKMERQLTAIKNLKKALILYSNQMNDRKYEDKSDREQRIDNLNNALFMELEKLKSEIEKGGQADRETKEEILASKMLKISNSLRKGKISILGEVADEFMQALELFDLAREAKEKGKTLALKDKYQGI